MAEDVKDSVIQKTQNTLGKHISKPTLTPKLLKKPPFRFLHDIITSVIKETGFLKGLFTEQEMISENVKERDAKIAFLTKLITAIGAISGTELDIKPGKIVAGLEATKTNKLLQIIGSCIDKKLDSAQYVNKLNSTDKPVKKSKKSNIEKISKTSKDVTPAESNRKSERASKTNKTASESKTKATNEKSSKTTDSTRKEGKTKISKNGEKEKIRKTIKNKPTVENVKNIEAPEKPKNIDEKIKENIEQDIAKPAIPEESKEQDVGQEMIVDKETNEGEQLQIEEKVMDQRETSAKTRPRSAKMQSDTIHNNKVEQQKEPIAGPTNFLRPPSVRPMSARPGAPRLRPESALSTNQIIPLGNINVIVENYNNQDDEETVVIQNVELPQEQLSVENVLNIPQDKGQLVEQILEQINDVDEFTQVKSARNDENLILDTHSRDVTQKEVQQLQNLVQTLTKVANPLGKLMNYLHEDLDGMHSELNMWVNMKKQAYVEIMKQKEQQSASSTALKQQLHDVEQNIKKIESEIAYVQSNILRNDVRIKQLLTR